MVSYLSHTEQQRQQRTDRFLCCLCCSASYREEVKEGRLPQVGECGFYPKEKPPTDEVNRPMLKDKQPTMAREASLPVLEMPVEDAAQHVRTAMELIGKGEPLQAVHDVLPQGRR